MSEGSWIRTEAKEIIIYLFTGIFMTILLGVVGGLILKGFDYSENFNVSSYLGAYIVYFFLILGSLFLIIFPISRLISGHHGEHPADTPKPSWFTIFTVSLIHSPEENGALYRMFDYLGFKQNKNPMRWSLSMFRCFMLAIIIFGTLGLLQIGYPQLAISSVPNTVAQQISPASDVIFGAGIPSFSENGILSLIFFFLLGVDAYICSKFRWGVSTFFIIGLLVISPLMGVTWMLMHGLIYSGSESKLFATFLFGWLGSTITLLTANFFFWLSWHFFNNASIKLSNLAVSRADVFFIYLICLVLLIILYIVGEILVHRYKKRHQEQIIIPR